MRRRLILVGILAMALGACGGESASPSASAPVESSSADAGGSAQPAVSAEPSAIPSASEDAITSSAVAVCDGIGLRKQPSSSSAKVKTISSGTEVHVVATVTGTAYTAASCGVSGSDWLKIDKVGGKSVKSAYGVSFVYAAAGFFQ